MEMQCPCPCCFFSMQVFVPAVMSAVCACLTCWDSDVQNLSASTGDTDWYMTASESWQSQRHWREALITGCCRSWMYHLDRRGDGLLVLRTSWMWRSLRAGGPHGMGVGCIMGSQLMSGSPFPANKAPRDYLPVHRTFRMGGNGFKMC